jgi:queuine tRNA-ribosyltransferase
MIWPLEGAVMGDFRVLNTDCDSQGRTGLIQTGHGKIETPAFMPVGTSGAVKGITPEQLTDVGASIVLANTYHLMLRPGVEVVEDLGGLHALMNWDGPILTDSGGYQVFSLSELAKIDDNGVEFSSHIDGSRLFLDAERATEIQNRLGADIIMCLDQCTSFPVEADDLKIAVDRTITWAKRCKNAHGKADQHLFGIVQGAIDPEMRAYCARELVKLDFDGYAIGGLGVGESHENMIRTVAHTTALLPEDKPRYLMGVGTPTDIIASVRAGIDMFDCVLPTRNGRNAFAFTPSGPVRLRNSIHIKSTEPIEAGCDCYCCRNFCRGAIRHFFNISEMLGPILVSIHNLRFYQRLMARIREKLKSGEFSRWAEKELQNRY